MHNEDGWPARGKLVLDVPLIVGAFHKLTVIYINHVTWSLEMFALGNNLEQLSVSLALQIVCD